MLVIPGEQGKATCDGMTRRELLRVGGSALLGLSLADHSSAARQGDCRQQPAAAAANQGPGWGRAKSVILLYLQGGPSHLDLWDPKDNVPDRVRSPFKAINTCLPGVRVTELLPQLSRVLDKTTLIRSMSYSPNGLFNHTAAIYQMLTGYQADAVSASGQLEPPTPRDFPNFGCNISASQAADRADAAVRDDAAAAAGKQRGRQGRHRRVPGPGLRSVLPLSARRRHGHEQDEPDLGRRSAAAARRLRRPPGAARPVARSHLRRHAGPGTGRGPLRPADLLQHGPQPGHLRPGPQRLRPEPAKTPACANAMA